MPKKVEEIPITAYINEICPNKKVLLKTGKIKTIEPLKNRIANLNI